MILIFKCAYNNVCDLWAAHTHTHTQKEAWKKYNNLKLYKIDMIYFWLDLFSFILCPIPSWTHTKMNEKKKTTTKCLGSIGSFNKKILKAWFVCLVPSFKSFVGKAKFSIKNFQIKRSNSQELFFWKSLQPLVQIK